MNGIAFSGHRYDGPNERGAFGLRVPMRSMGTRKKSDHIGGY